MIEGYQNENACSCKYHCQTFAADKKGHGGLNITFLLYFKEAGISPVIKNITRSISCRRNEDIDTRAFFVTLA